MEKKFTVGDKVFAKVRGHPAWPAIIDGLVDDTLNKEKYNVVFYGTFQSAVCKVEDLHHYDESKEKYGKPMKRRKFNEALEQIEAHALLPQLVAKVENPSGEDSKSDVKGNLVIDEAGKKSGEIEETKAVKRKRESDAFAENHERNVGKENSDPMQAKAGRFSPTRTTAGDLVDIIEDQSAPRVIESEQEHAQCESVVAANVAQLESGGPLPARIQYQLNERKRQQNTAQEIIKFRNIVHKKKRELKFLEVESRMLALDIFIDGHLTLSQLMGALDDMTSLALEPLMLKKHPQVAESVSRPQSMRVMQFLWNALWQLLIYSQKERHGFRARNIPEALEMIQNLYKSVGNTSIWDYIDEEEVEFSHQVKQVQAKVERLLKKFELMFMVPEGQTFWQVFADEVSEFKKKTLSYTRDKFLALTTDPTKRTSSRSRKGSSTNSSETVGEPEEESEHRTGSDGANSNGDSDHPSLNKADEEEEEEENMGLRMSKEERCKSPQD